MLLHRKSLAFVAPSSEKYLIFILLQVRKLTVISLAKNYQKFTTTKGTALARLIWPIRYKSPVCHVEHVCLTFTSRRFVDFGVVDQSCVLKTLPDDVADFVDCDWSDEVFHHHLYHQHPHQHPHHHRRRRRRYSHQ